MVLGGHHYFSVLLFQGGMTGNKCSSKGHLEEAVVVVGGLLFSSLAPRENRRHPGWWLALGCLSSQQWWQSLTEEQQHGDLNTIVTESALVVGVWGTVIFFLGAAASSLKAHTDIRVWCLWATALLHYRVFLSFHEGQKYNFFLNESLDTDVITWL